MDCFIELSSDFSAVLVDIVPGHVKFAFSAVTSEESIDLCPRKTFVSRSSFLLQRKQEHASFTRESTTKTKLNNYGSNWMKKYAPTCYRMAPLNLARTGASRDRAKDTASFVAPAIN